MTFEYLREFAKKFEMILMLLSRTCGMMIQEKKPEAKISLHCPFSVRIPVSRKIRVGDYSKAKFRKYKLLEDSKLRKNHKKIALSLLLYLII